MGQAVRQYYEIFSRIGTSRRLSPRTDAWAEELGREHEAARDKAWAEERRGEHEAARDKA